jgi:hypothetical protein
VNSDDEINKNRMEQLLEKFEIDLIIAGLEYLTKDSEQYYFSLFTIHF